MSKLDLFFNPIVYDTAHKTWLESLTETVDDCFYFGGRRIHVKSGRARLIDEPELSTEEKSRRFVKCYLLLPCISLLLAAKVALNPRETLTGLYADSSKKPIRASSQQEKISQIISKKNGYYATPDDLKRMEKDQWLNDACVNTFLEVVLAKSKNCIMANSYFAQCFNEQRPYKLFRKSDGSTPTSLYQEKKPIFMPLNVGGAHWALLVIDFSKRKLCYYDSLSMRPGAEVEKVKAILQTLAAKENVSLAKKDWQCVIEKCPQQTNGNDCGVFTCMAAERLMQGLPLDYSARDVPSARRRMLTELQKRN